MSRMDANADLRAASCARCTALSADLPVAKYPARSSTGIRSAGLTAELTFRFAAPRNDSRGVVELASADFCLVGRRGHRFRNMNAILGEGRRVSDRRRLMAAELRTRVPDPRPGQSVQSRHATRRVGRSKRVDSIEYF